MFSRWTPERSGAADDRIARHLLACFAAVGLAALLGATFAASRLESQMSGHRSFHEPALSAVWQIQSQLNQAVQESFAYLAAAEAEAKHEYRTLVESFESTAQQFREIARLEEPGEEAERASFELIEAMAGTLFERTESMFTAYEEGRAIHPLEFAEYELLIDRINGELAALIEMERAEVAADHDELVALLGHSERIVIGIGILILALALLFGHGVGKAMARRATAIRRAEKEKHRLELEVEKQQKLESLGVLAGGVAHDFNNLLVGIMGNAEVALGSADDPPLMHEALQDIRSASVRSAELVRELMAYTGKVTLHTRPIEVSALVTEVVRLLGSRLPENVSCEIVAGEGEVWSEGDDTQIRQVAMNLVTNAADALAGRTGTIRIEIGLADLAEGHSEAGAALSVPRPGSYVFLDVSDDGRGIAPESISRIFDPFFTTKRAGRGLGLAAMLGILRAHGGGVEVFSEPGRGSRFRILLPRIPKPPGVAAPDVTRTPQRSVRATVLVIDDQEAVLNTTRRILKSEGFDVVTARGGYEAIETLKKQAEDIDVAVLDLTMPDLDGPKTFEALRRIRGDLPVVFCSGHAEVDAAFVSAGFEHTSFLQKPFSTESLLQKLGEVGL